MRLVILFHTIASTSTLVYAGTTSQSSQGLWSIYQSALRTAKYIDLTHTLKPSTPVWHGFQNPQVFASSINPDNDDQPYTYAEDGFEATSYQLSTDQYGTQLDPPAHWDPYYPAIDELPATFSIRPLVVISIVDQVTKDQGYQMQVSDIENWEKQHGRIPEGAVAMIRSDFYRRWEEPDFPDIFPFPGVTLDALKFLQEKRNILFHGHEALDTDTTKTLEGEAWLLHNGYTQAEAVKNLDKVAPTGRVIQFFFKFSMGVEVVGIYHESQRNIHRYDA